ncbi:tRNA (cytidine(34)-2'-O)-methyltransferase [Malaciobacter pacificus]|uniref:Putative tRNA (cytidine(34)-2'-O)-methyltransferase n=1 Tax=Malaciobacter pacificus TaxID=1080223 RepID=A0A5C2H6M6_9BACT|nr:tRNA (cytidine(34)-2'-O)-methyltransferase [Malaciobacter pacificus]QEP34611.1 rRNA methylase, SpoU family [Malaciobacter pacificus]GGD37376.1 tRNA (cytidine(34)-2'-O)-methyltransferase [Malaciobacter pacificus]
MFNIVLHEPRIPGNVGTIGRLAFAMNCKLHLIKPYGFGEITEKEVRRAGLDYWFDLEVYEYENIEEFWEKNPLNNRHFFATTKTDKVYFDAKFLPNDYIYFGREDAGLPESIMDKNKAGCVTIPMTNDARSLNIANSVSIIAYEALRQNFSEFK